MVIQYLYGFCPNHLAKGRNNINMGKITEIKFVGQPICKQIMNLMEKVDINGRLRKHGSDYYYKSVETRTQLYMILLGILYMIGQDMKKDAIKKP